MVPDQRALARVKVRHPGVVFSPPAKPRKFSDLSNMGRLDKLNVDSEAG
jgi:hypothetical protein